MLVEPNYVFSLGVPKIGFVPFSCSCTGLSGGFPKKMAQSFENSDVGVENKLGLVRPASEAYAQEAFEALRNGNVIAVPTDTLYGFACDAWYGSK